MVNQAKEVNINRSTREKKGTNKKEGLNYSVNTLSLQEVIDRVAAPRTRSFSASDAKRRDIMGSDEENTPKSRNVQTRQTLNNNKKKSQTQGSPCLRSNPKFSSSQITSGLAPHPKAAAASRESTPESDAGYGTSLNMSASPDESLAELVRSMKLKSGGQEGFKGSDGGSVLQHQLPPISETDPAVAEAVRSPDPLFPQPLMPQGPNLLQTLLGFPSQPQPDIHQHQQQLSAPYYPTQHLLPPFPTGGPLPGAFHASPDPFALERAAKQNRNAASVSEVACTWSGQLPPPGRTRGPPVYSTKVFLGGVPWDLTERCVQQAFRQFGPVKVEWPGKGSEEGAPKGYVYLVLEKEGAVPALLSQVMKLRHEKKMYDFCL